jgi:serine/threonine protein kinase
MPKRMLTCPCGHSWKQENSGPLPEDLSAICPVCAAAREGTLQNAAPAGGAGTATKAPPSPFLHPGEVLAGFEILEEINRGGMGVIYKARQQGLNRLVALKVIAPERFSRPDSLRRFRREVQAAALLSHPNIVTVFYTELDAPRPYLAMEYVPGIDLFRLVKRAGPLPVADALLDVKEAAQGLQHAFEQGLVHRDIKPANLMVTPSPLEPPATPPRPPRVKILDMGLARVVAAGDAAEASASLTQDGEFLGTPDFISPEQAEDSRRVDIRSDLYSLGGTLYFLLTGQVPFPGANLVQKLRRQLTEAPPSVAARRLDVPPEVDALVSRLMDRNPAKRFETPAELIAALEGIRARPGGLSRPAAHAPAVAETSSAAAAASTATGGTSSATGTPPSSHNSPAQVEAHPGGVTALCVSSDGQVLLTGGLDETLRLWDAHRLRTQRILREHVGPVEDACLAPGGKWAASCSRRLFFQDRIVQLWDLATGKQRRRLKGHTDRVRRVAVSPAGKHVASSSADHTIRVWDVDQPSAAALSLHGHTDTVTCLAFLPAGEALLSGGHDGTVRLWDTRNGAAKGTIPGQVGPVEALAFGGPSKRVAIAGDELRVRQANGTFTQLHGHRGPVLCVAFSSDGLLLLSGGSDNTVRLWRAEDGEELRCFEGHTGKVHAVAFAPDGRFAYSGSADGTVRRWPLGSCP